MDKKKSDPKQNSSSDIKQADAPPLVEDAGNMMFAFIHFVMNLFFFMAAYVNLNDPDAEIWVTLYAFAAIIAFATALNMVHMLPAIPAIIPLFILTISGIWSYYLSQEIEYPSNLWEFFETEQGREIGGLAMLGFEMLLIVLTQLFASGKSGSSSFLMTSIYWGFFSVVVYAFYATFFLQPDMNKRLQVPHCKGSIYE